MNLWGALGRMRFVLPPRRTAFGRAQPAPALLSNMSGSLTFKIDFGQPRMLPAIDANESEALWRELDPSLSYSGLIDALLAAKSPNTFKTLFRPPGPDDPPLFELVRSFVRYFPLILPRNPLIIIVGSPILDFRALLKTMPPKSDALFNSVLNVIHIILSNTESPVVQSQLLHWFAVSLTPHEMSSPEVDREYIQYTSVLPMKNFQERVFWLMVHRDGSVSVIPSDGLSETIQSSLDQIDVRSHHVIVNTNLIFQFPKDSVREQYHANMKITDPLVSFLSCFRECAPYRENLPKEFCQQLFDAISSPDLVLAVAVCTALFQNYRDHMANILAAMSHAETLTIFFRSRFAIDVDAIQDPGRIFRDNSVGMAACGILMRLHSEDVMAELVRAVQDEASGNPLAILRKWMPLLQKIPAMNRFILRTAFLTARRKYPENLVPLTAVSGVLMLRYVMAEISPKLLPERIPLLQQIMNIVVFKQETRQLGCDVRDFRAIADFLLDLIKLKTNSIRKEGFVMDQLIESVIIVVDNVLNLLKKPQPEHPIVWSIQELLETVFTGVEDDYKERVAGSTDFS
jgi:hypothetical protein